jgi:hypothetical protein
MEAKVVSESDQGEYELVEVNGHKLQFGGRDGDGYCYGHQSFDCQDNLTTEEIAALDAV